ncbi:MAG: hypothetical protein KDA28_11920, partial [Phycisphaerales bacterium]|nr:hypothetical protein [Phycisphaerales bacterium]
VAVTVFAPTEEGRPRWLRPGRYIYEPDGILRVQTGRVSPRTYPSPTRRLREVERERLWRLVVDTGFLDGVHLGEVASWEGLEPARDETIALVSTSWGGHQRLILTDLDTSSADAAAAAQLIDHLAELAWIRE